MPNSKGKTLQINLVPAKHEAKISLQNTLRKRNSVSHLTPSEHVKNAKQWHELKQKPAMKVRRNELRNHKRVRLNNTYRHNDTCGFAVVDFER